MALILQILPCGDSGAGWLLRFSGTYVLNPNNMTGGRLVRRDCADV